MSHIAIIGAGAVGVACASAIIHAQVATRISLFDLDAAKADGEALDFAHAAPLVGNWRVDGGGLDQYESAEVCVITAGAKQRPHETRLELLQRNAASLSDLARVLEAKRLPRVAVVITNPVDVMTQLLRERWSTRDVAVLGTGTLLDTMRLRALLGTTFGVSAESVHAWVLGEHGDSSACLLDSARVAGQPLEQFAAGRGLRFHDAERAEVVRTIRGAAAAVIARKGATSHAIGLVTARILRAIVRDEGAILPVSAPVEDAVCAGVPCLVGRAGATAVGVPAMSPREAEAFETSLAVLRSSRQSLRC